MYDSDKAHTHLNCPGYGWGTACREGGHYSGQCDSEYPDADWACYNEYCSDLGMCPCNCHSGKSCEECGYYWPKMEKQDG